MFSWSLRTRAILGLVLIGIFSALGALLSTVPSETLQALPFGAILAAFFTTFEARSICALIFADLLTGVIAALRTNTYDPQKTFKFFSTNVIPYVLGFLLWWGFTYLGLDTVSPPEVRAGIVALGYGGVAATLAASILDNVTRARLGTTPPETDLMLAEQTKDAFG